MCCKEGVSERKISIWNVVDTMVKYVILITL